ncbi:MAG: hypothetical protein LQ350_008433 [Teloschistes chrysophthalmus]|nr:MAG: hypothetical protein LQ350_008433 [Niorma chrysophthalma]
MAGTIEWSRYHVYARRDSKRKFPTKKLVGLRDRYDYCHASRIIRLKSAGRQEKLDGAVSWFVPNGVNVKQDVGSGKSEGNPSTRRYNASYNSFKSGDKAASSIAIDASLAANYMAIGGDISANYAIQKTFQKQYQYAMFAFNQVLLEVGFDDYAKTVDEVLLLRRLRRMDPFDPRKPGVIQQYRSLFATIGTHIITGANYGGRLQLLVWADNSDQSVDEEFGIDVAAEFNGLTTSGKVDVRVKSEKQFQTFEQSVMKSSSCLGGDPKLSANIGSNPSSDGIFETFQTWVKTADTNPKIMSFQTIALWDLMSAARSDVLAKRAPDIAKAYQWIVENPEQHLTKARMVISSDWGEVGISTPSAYILKDPSQPDIPGLLYSATKVSWTANGGPPTQMTIE